MARTNQRIPNNITPPGTHAFYAPQIAAKLIQLSRAKSGDTIEVGINNGNASSAWLTKTAGYDDLRDALGQFLNEIALRDVDPNTRRKWQGTIRFRVSPSNVLSPYYDLAPATYKPRPKDYTPFLALNGLTYCLQQYKG